MSLTSLCNVALRDGTTLEVRLGQNGLSELQPALAALLSPSGFPDLDIVDRILLDDVGEDNLTQHVFGFRQEKLVGYLRYDASQRIPYLCSLGYVFTAEEARSLGIALKMCRAAVDNFSREGGKAAYLATESGSAKHIYQKAGFRDFNGHIMRWVNKNDENTFDRFYFPEDAIAAIRDLRWSDWAMAAVLYGQPSETHIRDYGSKLYSGQGQEIDRFQSVIPPLIRLQETGGAFVKAAENKLGHLVGIATLHRQEKDHFLVDFFVHPCAEDATTALLDHMVLKAKEIGCPQLIAKIARADEHKLKTCQDLGARIASESLESTGENRVEPVCELHF